MATADFMLPANEMDSQVSYRSSSFTNPDLLLPQPSRPSPSPPTSSSRHTFQAIVPDRQTMETRLANGDGLGLGLDSAQYAQRAISPLILRPGLPGAWQTEEELPTMKSTRNDSSLPIQSSPTVPDDPYDLRQASPTLSGDEEEDPFAGFDSEIDDGGGIMSPGGTAILTVVSHPIAPSPAESQFKFPSFSTERSQTNEVEEDLTSHAAMSMRAETILANAKKRLLEMEDNLSRARRSLSPSTTKSRNAMRLSLRKVDIGGISENPDSWSLTPRKRQDDSNAQSGIFSTPLAEEGTNSRSHRGKRAVSAMGYLSPRAADWEPEDDEDPWTPLSRSTSNGGRQCDILKSVEEIEPEHANGSLDLLRHKFRHSRDSPRDEDGHASSRSPYLDPQAPHEVKRARSSTQIRDLREQMQDLRGRISSLRQRTREDSLQRQSMQKIKSPSPFTVTPGWDDEDAMDSKLSPRQANGASVGDVANTEPELPVEISAFEPDTPDESTDDPFDDISPLQESPALEPDSDPYTLDHGVVSPTTPPRSSLPPSPGPRTPAHEDRPDAFNYEQYFLTSALPRYNKHIDPNLFAPENTPFKAQNPPSVNVRRNTQSSSSSASTTKAVSPSAVHESSTSSPGTEGMFSPKTLGGSHPSSPNKSLHTLEESSSNVPHASQKGTTSSISHKESSLTGPSSTAPLPLFSQTNSSHLRQNSGDSISTVNTFATATENTHSPSSVGGTYEDDSAAISNLGIGFSHPGWQAGRDTRSRSGTVTQNSLANGHTLRLLIDSNTGDKRLSSNAKTPTKTETSSQKSSNENPNLQLPNISHFGDVERQLVEDLLDALSRMCLDAQDLGDENVYERKVLRRKLDGARRVLDGEREGVLKS